MFTAARVTIGKVKITLCGQTKWEYITFVLMQRITFFLALPFLWLIACLPWPLLRGLSDGIYFVAYKCFKYRRDVVRTNLKNAFPQAAPEELRLIEKKYYRHLADLITETFRLKSMNEKDIHKHVVYHNSEMLDELHQKNRKVMLVLGHLGNWEWMLHKCVLGTAYRDLLVIYHSLSHPYFDQYIKGIRSKSGASLVTMEKTLRAMVQKKNDTYAAAVVADQNPRPKNAYWTDFLQQDTPFFKGPEALARKFNFAVVYVSIKKTKRNHYSLHTKLITDSPENEPEGEIIEKFKNELQKDIIDQPEIWLWSHRRWKHKRHLQ